MNIIIEINWETLLCFDPEKMPTFTCMCFALSNMADSPNAICGRALYVCKSLNMPGIFCCVCIFITFFNCSSIKYHKLRFIWKLKHSPFMFWTTVSKVLKNKSA